jgi:hypothetical protein
MQLRQLSLPQSSSHHLDIYPFASLQAIPDNKLFYNINFGASNHRIWLALQLATIIALPNMANAVLARDLGREMVGREMQSRKSIMNGNGHAVSVDMQQWTQKRRRFAQNVVIINVVVTVRWRRSRDIGHDVRQWYIYPTLCYNFLSIPLGHRLISDSFIADSLSRATSCNDGLLAFSF